MNIKKIEYLDIAKNKINFAANNIGEELDYSKWVEHIMQHSDYFIWDEDTKEGKHTLAEIDKVPENFRERVLRSLNKIGCYAEYNNKKGYYDINVGFLSEYNRISINFERPLTVNDLKRFLDMATYLDALLLSHGKDIIDKKVIESLE
jgi:hypothetical protein